MITFNAHFDGNVIVPEHAVDLPRDRTFVVHVEPSGTAELAPGKPPVHALAWQRYLVQSGASIVTTEAVYREWLNAMSSAATRAAAALGFERISHDPRIEVIPHSGELSADAIRLFAARSDKNWSLTDCLSFVVMERRNIREALTADNHFEQAGFHAILTQSNRT